MAWDYIETNLNKVMPSTYVVQWTHEGKVRWEGFFVASEAMAKVRVLQDLGCMVKLTEPMVDVEDYYYEPE